MIDDLQRVNVGIEQQLVETQSAVAFLCWRLAARGVLDESDMPADNVANIH